MKNKAINAVIILLFILFVFLSGYLTRCSRENGIEIMESQYEQEINNQQGIIDSLHSCVETQMQTIDSLKVIKAERDTIWRTRITALESLTFVEQYNVLREQMQTLCQLIMPENCYYSNKDTLLAVGNADLLCINTAFLERDMFEEQVYATENILAGTEEVVRTQGEIILHQDTVLTYKDSTILVKESQIIQLQNTNKNLKGWLKAAGGFGVLVFTLLILK